MTSFKGAAHASAVFGTSAIVGLTLLLLQGTINGFTITDLLAGILTTLVIWVLKKIFDVERQLAALREIVRSNKEELNRVRNEELPSLSQRMRALEQGEAK